jgi:hypothetical protein
MIRERVLVLRYTYIASPVIMRTRLNGSHKRRMRTCGQDSSGVKFIRYF